MPLSTIANHSAAHRFALNPKVGSACITITEYDVLGRQLMNGHDDKGYWWRHLTGDPDYRTAVVDSTNLTLIQTSNPQAAHGTSRELYEWLGIMGWKDFPVQVKYSITTETSAVLHLYTCEGFTTRGTISVIHVISPDYRGKPSATCAEFASELTQAYKNVFTLFNQTGLQCLRIQPISGGCISGCFQDTHPILTVAAVQAAYSLLPEETQVALRSTNIEICI